MGLFHDTLKKALHHAEKNDFIGAKEIIVQHGRHIDQVVFAEDKLIKMISNALIKYRAELLETLEACDRSNKEDVAEHIKEARRQIKNIDDMLHNFMHTEDSLE